CTRDHSGFDFW
nr:immunoglobulin heavy chain junction region [Macaca mulatta]MOW80557.1 immunoglobulin heavy chain junction region [Macaca mulatta]MOW82674.1 immunoglobulin heavy chain junction region [Macaca mulatta]